MCKLHIVWNWMVPSCRETSVKWKGAHWKCVINLISLNVGFLWSFKVFSHYPSAIMFMITNFWKFYQSFFCPRGNKLYEAKQNSWWNLVPKALNRPWADGRTKVSTTVTLSSGCTGVADAQWLLFLTLMYPVSSTCCFKTRPTSECTYSKSLPHW